ncbi:F-box/LRR-repeat protein [Rhynchospora pubera]|uniref:F-box/LRR-repeat protein n=1 Tax=Rhynchospora pubera TaxID=906938 RepID=A0AAV8G0U9_9POAL|nr:F-box/LRR-repeat protein [Rhynchospora pubera]
MGTTHLEDLPSHLLVEILSRVGDSADLASCRLASRTFLSLSRLVTSVSVSFHSASPVPFKSRVRNLASLLSASPLSLSLSTERGRVAPDADSDEDDGFWFDDADDLHLMSVDFLSSWLPLVCERLAELSVADYWFQSCFRRSDALSLISVLCNKLLKLEVRNAWLSVNGLKPMLRLTSLTLQFIRLDDEDLEKINECFPHLQFLSLIGVGGLKKPHVCLSHLETFVWSVSDTPKSIAIHAPHLTELRLSCIEPKFFSLETPHLSLLDLMIERPSGDIKLGHFQDLETLRFRSWDYPKLFKVLNGVHTVKTLELNVPYGEVPAKLESRVVMISDFVELFCGLEELQLFGLARYFIHSGDEDVKVCLKRLVIEVEVSDFYDFKTISEVLKMCMPCEVVLMFSADDPPTAIKKEIIDKYAQTFPEFRWNEMVGMVCN